MLKITKILCISRRHCAEKEKNQGKNNSKEKGQVKGIDEQRKLSQVSVTSQPWWAVWQDTGHRNTLAELLVLGNPAGSQVGLQTEGLGLWSGGPAGSGSPALCSEPPGRNSHWEWLQGDCRGLGMSLPPAGL